MNKTTTNQKLDPTGSVRMEVVGDELTIELHGLVGEDFWSDGTTSKDVFQQLNDFKGDTINVSINSPGGSASDGISIYNQLRAHDADVFVDVTGLAASAASIVAMAGDEIRIADNAMIMIHDPWTVEMGSATDLRAAADVLDKWGSAAVLSYQRKTDLESDALIEMMSDETWMLGEEAVSLGFADVAYSDEEKTGVKVAACLQDYMMTHYKNVPDSVQFAEEYTPPQAGEEEEEATDGNDESVDEVEEQVEEKADDVEEQLEERADEVEKEVRNQLGLFLNAFGADGATWFSEGKTFDECSELHIKNLQTIIANQNKDIEKLEAKLAAAINASGEAEPLAGDDPDRKSGGGLMTRIRFAHNGSDN